MIEILDLLYNLFVNDVFGSKILFGLFILLGAGFFAFKMRMSFDAFAVSGAALVIFLAGIGLIPKWIIGVIVMIIGLIIASALLRVGRR